jgi:hypothetical protein
MGNGVFIAAAVGIAAGSIAATLYWMANPPNQKTGCNCPDDDVCTITGPNGLAECPTGSSADELYPGCCTPTPIIGAGVDMKGVA